MAPQQNISQPQQDPPQTNIEIDKEKRVPLPSLFFI